MPEGGHPGGNADGSSITPEKYRRGHTLNGKIVFTNA